MKKTFFAATLSALLVMLSAKAEVIVLDKEELMHEIRATESPLNGAVVTLNPPVLLWPDPTMAGRNVGLDGAETKHEPRASVSYKVWLARDAELKKDVETADCRWAFYKPSRLLAAGKWYWRYSYATDNGRNFTSPVYSFTVSADATPFNTPSVGAFLKALPKGHPRVLLLPDEWAGFIERTKGTPQREWYLKKAEAVLKEPISSIDDTNVSAIEGLDNQVKRKALLTRESRRIVDKEEINVESLVRSYLLTRDQRFAKAAIDRIREIISWNDSPYLAGDFNKSVVLSTATMAYDSFYDILSPADKAILLDAIRTNGKDFFNEYQANLESLLANNHVWQMTLRILTMAAVATYGDLPEANDWLTYCYTVWNARFPGLNADGAWHNGDSYFHVNLRTLIEVPYFYSRVTGFDFFSDPWYKGSAMYVIYNQPPFSKSGGNGSSHQNTVTPSSARMLYAEVLARFTDNGYAADYVRIIEQGDKDLRRHALFNKPGDLTWTLLRTDKKMPTAVPLTKLPNTHVFPWSGVVLAQSDWSDYRKNAMLSFRSSPYGSTSHAMANQNAFNTFYGGKSLFYSSGHHIAFTDQHSIYCHRATRAHNTILVNGMGQKIGVEGYGWIPRYYQGDKLSYWVGDASHAYGQVTSALWKERAQLSDVHFTPANGWDKNHVKRFRRHVITLGDASLTVILDELVADTAVKWSYLLHTVEKQMEIIPASDNAAHVRATNSANGVSDAYIFASSPLNVSQTDQFFYPAKNWLRADDKGKFHQYSNHWHTTVESAPAAIYTFVSVINTRAQSAEPIVVQRLADGSIKVAQWIVKYSTAADGSLSFTVRNADGSAEIVGADKTSIKDGDKKCVLSDKLPELEI